MPMAEPDESFPGQSPQQYSFNADLDCRKIGDELVGTMELILKPSFADWLKGIDSPSPVFISGRPGAGKTILAQSLVRSFLQQEAKEQLFFFMVSSPFSNNAFVPSGALSAILTRERIFDMLGPHTGPLARHAENYRKLLATLILADRGASDLLKFVRQGIDDDDLPLSREVVEHCFGLETERQRDSPESGLEHISQVVEGFLKWQWTLLSPVFKPLDGPPVHYKFAEQEILPFIHPKPGVDHDIHTGGFGRVQQVAIHPDHVQGWHVSQKHILAVKRMISNKGHIQFKREIEAYRLLSETKHAHITKMLASFEQNGERSILLEGAQGNLSDLLHSSTTSDSLLERWFLNQAIGLVDALRVIHGLYTAVFTPMDKAMGRNKPPEMFYGLHGDLKPTNILWFYYTTKDYGALKLADFGCARFLNRGSLPLEYADRVPHSPAYRPPECDLPKTRLTQSCDVWSLGCIFADVATFLALGSQGVADFARLRGTKGLGNTRCNAFFEVDSRSSPPTAETKSAVVGWLKQLCDSPKTSSFTRDLASMVQQEMLVVERPSLAGSKKRASMGRIHALLSAMRDVGDSQPHYFEPCGEEPRINGLLRLSGHIELAEMEEIMITQYQTLKDPASSTKSSTNAKRKQSEDESLAEHSRSYQKQKTCSDSSTEPERRFACPFFQKNSSKFRNWRGCPGPGFKPVHRVKEHIYRVHSRGKFSCIRCGDNFKTESHLFDHQRAPEQCSVDDSPAEEGKITREQELILKQRNKDQNLTDEEKWVKIYQTIFPSDGEFTVPSPYYDEVETTISNSTVSTATSTILSDYKDYLMQPAKQAALELKVCQKLGVTDPTMCQLMAQTLREVQLEDLQEFDEDRFRGKDLAIELGDEEWATEFMNLTA